MLQRLPLLALAVFILAGLSACGHVPLRSLPALMKIDMMTTNLSLLRVAVIMPKTVMPRPEGLRLSLTVEGEAFHEEKEFALADDRKSDDDVLLRAQAGSAGRLMIFGLKEVEAAERFRAEIKEMKRQGGGKVKAGILADKLCLLPGGLEGPVVATVFLKTSETGTYVMLLDGVDLSELKEVREVIKALPPCGKE